MGSGRALTRRGDGEDSLYKDGLRQVSDRPFVEFLICCVTSCTQDGILVNVQDAGWSEAALNEFPAEFEIQAVSWLSVPWEYRDRHIFYDYRLIDDDGGPVGNPNAGDIVVDSAAFTRPGANLRVALPLSITQRILKPGEYFLEFDLQGTDLLTSEKKTIPITFLQAV